MVSSQTEKLRETKIIQALSTSLRKMVNTLCKFFILLMAVLFSACANIQPPNGGPDDDTAAVLLKSVPKNNSTNYKGKTITLYFNENVDASKLRESMIISPLTESQYDVVTRKKIVTLRFKDDFKENTTYSFNFGESIKDVTKGNTTKNLNLAFSTGSFIDSLSVKGQAYNFVRGGGMKDVSIQLYKAEDTSNVKNSRPLYFTKTDASGGFTINNVKAGTYNIYAFQDQNKNYLYDNEKENIAYMYNVEVNKDVSKLKLGLTRSDTKAPEIVGQKPEYEYYIFTLNEGVENYNLRSDIKKPLSDISEDRKTIHIFNTFNSKDSINIYYQLTDSSGNTTNDTTKIQFEEYRDKDKKNTFTLNIEPKSKQLLKNEEIGILFNKPVAKINYALIKIKKDTSIIDSAALNLEPDSTKLKIKISGLSTFKDSLSLVFQKGAFINIAGDSSPAYKTKLNYKKEENFGILGGKIICNEPNYIFQLINSKGKVIDSKPNATKFYYTWLEPDNYQLKVIIDVNNNGRWDATNIFKGIPPEPVKFYKEKINLRANWELLDIIFEVK
jgi:uncharacterized protein (DUF2141 family)